MNSLTAAFLVTTATTESPPDDTYDTPDFSTPNGKFCQLTGDFSFWDMYYNIDLFNKNFPDSLKIEENCFELCAVMAHEWANVCCTYTLEAKYDEEYYDCEEYDCEEYKTCRLKYKLSEVPVVKTKNTDGGERESAWVWEQFKGPVVDAEPIPYKGTLRQVYPNKKMVDSSKWSGSEMDGAATMDFFMDRKRMDIYRANDPGKFA